jgi:hypothetical protein
MTFLVSPGVSVAEFDLTQTIPAVAETPAAIAGVYLWGPAFQPVLVQGEPNYVQVFGPPANLNGETWFSGQSFLAYGGNLYVVRCVDTAGNTVQQTTSANLSGGNSVVLMANTTGIANGMALLYCNSTALSPNQGGIVTVLSTNTTSVTLSTAPTVNSGTVASLVFRTNIAYTAFAQQGSNSTNQLAFSSNANIINANGYNSLAGTINPTLCYAARYVGNLGNSLRISVCETPTQFTSNIDLTDSANTSLNTAACVWAGNVGSNVLSVTVSPANTSNAADVSLANTIAVNALASLSNGDWILFGNSTVGFDELQVSGLSASVSNVGNIFTFSINTTENYGLVSNTSWPNIQRYWEFFNLVGVAPGQSAYQVTYGNNQANDQLSIVVVDNNGLFTGKPGTVLETYRNLSRATDNQLPNGLTNYYCTVINQQSSYIWWTNDRFGASSNTSQYLQSSINDNVFDETFYGGADGLGEGAIDMGAIINGYAYYVSPQNIDIGLVITGKALGISGFGNTQLATWLINNIAEERKDCVVFCSPDIADTVNAGTVTSFIANTVIQHRQNLPSSSYGFMDSGHKYTYDRYNNVYRYVPLNGDMAGLCCQTDMTNAPWWSPAGFNRGNVKNVVQLSWNPAPSDRDVLYSEGVNPVVTFKNPPFASGPIGTVLYGDKTLFAQNSAFNRINVRRLFIVLEKAIATAAQYYLFEFNDSFTQAQFRAMCTPFLADIKAQRGLIAFDVRCDSTNNPPEVVQANEFIADIFVMPNYSINWIRLNFVNVPPTLTFAEAESIQY